VRNLHGAGGLTDIPGDYPLVTGEVGGKKARLPKSVLRDSGLLNTRNRRRHRAPWSDYDQ